MACSTRIVETLDNEEQKNGTYLNFQAATSGSGGTITTNNANAPDSFCPLGWQLPYSGTGGDYYDKSKSWKYLFNEYSIRSSSEGSTKTRHRPFSFVYSGHYGFSAAALFRQGNNFSVWSQTIAGTDLGYRISIMDTFITSDDQNGKFSAQPIRRVLEF